jgi:hypothetical protein
VTPAMVPDAIPSWPSRFFNKMDKPCRIYKTIIFPVVLYGCETCSLTFRAENSLRVFEYRVLRRIFGSKRDEESWRKLHNEEHHNFYCSPSIITRIKSRRMRLAGHVSRMGRT